MKTCRNRYCAAGQLKGEAYRLGLCPACQFVGRRAFAAGLVLAGLLFGLLEATLERRPLAPPAPPKNLRILPTK